ncbi:hypothetical protein ACPF7I_06235 [Anoxybacillus sp. D401a]|uniref:hypothetical protein n=1 Tax=Anoxybacillus sp. D401a TaxID=575112 RepID=UPI003D33B92F
MSNVKQYLKEKGYNLNDDKELLRAFADAKINLQASQEEFASAVGITSRTIRNKIAKDRAYYNACLEEFSSVAEEQGKLTEEQLSKFVDNILALGLNPKSAKDIQLFIDFFGITADDVKKIIQIKKASLRGWLKDAQLDYMDMESVYKNLFTMDCLYNQNEQSVGATERAYSMDLNEPLTQYRLMYMGAVFMSLYNQAEYSDLLDQLAVLMKLEQLEQGVHIQIDRKLRTEAQKLAGTYKRPNLTDEEYKSLLREIGVSEETLKTLQNKPKVKELPDRETVEELHENHYEQLEGYLTAEQELSRLLKGGF